MEAEGPGVLPGDGELAVGPQPVPVTAQQVADWLPAALAERGMPGLVAASPVEPIEGTATKLRMALQWESGATGPARIIVKGGFSAHRERMSYIYAHEARFYREMAGEAGLTVPLCHGTGESPEQRQYLVLLEDLDLAGARFCRVEQPIGREVAERFLDGLARLHARFWGSSIFETGGQLALLNHWEALPPGPRGAYARSRLDEAVFRQCLDLPRGRALPRLFHDHGRMTAALERLTVFGHERPHCLIHGDFHLGNLYLTAEGAAGALDWQTWSRGHWAQDVAYFLVSSLDILDRRAWIEPLLAHYLARLAAHGVAAPPGFAQAMEAFRLHLAYGLFVWLTNPPQFQSEANNAAVTPRFAWAALDHGLFDDL